MRFLLLILTIISFQNCSFAAEDKIVAIVNKKPITLSELEQRKKIMRFFGNVHNLSAEQEKAFSSSILDSLIEDEVLSQYAEKSRIKVQDAEIKNFIGNIEANNKMPSGQLEKSVTNLHVSHDAFKETIPQDAMMTKLINP